MTLAIAIALVVAGDLPVPAFGGRHHHPVARGADLAHRHLRGDVRVRLFDQQHDALALTLSVGFVVDDAIVMLENIVRHIEGGMTPFEAALKGSREIGFTIISITLSLIAVFIPVLLMGGMVGRVFREFAVTITVTILISGFVSLTLDADAVRTRAQAHHEGEKPEHRAARVRAMFKSWLRGYEVTLDVVLKYRFATLMVMIATLVGTGWLYIVIPKGLFPDRGYRFH